MATTDNNNNNNLDSIFLFFTKPFIAFKIFYFLWSNDTLEKNSFFINLPVENLETELYTIRDDFVRSSMQKHIFRGTFSRNKAKNVQQYSSSAVHSLHSVHSFTSRYSMNISSEPIIK